MENYPDMQSYEECKESIRFYANLIANSDDTSVMINENREISLRDMLDLYKQHLNTMKETKHEDRDPVYYRFGKKYRKIGRHEVIKKGALQSLSGREPKPIKSPDTVGDTPSSFLPGREFYNPVEE